MTGSQVLQGVAEKEWGDIFQEGCHFHMKNKLKSEIFNDQREFIKKLFFSVITKNLNWGILIKNLATIKRWDGVKHEEF